MYSDLQRHIILKPHKIQLKFYSFCDFLRNGTQVQALMCRDVPRYKQTPSSQVGLASAYYAQITQNPAEIPLIRRLFAKWNPSSSPDVPWCTTVQRDSNLRVWTRNGILYWNHTKSGWNSTYFASFCEMEPKLKPWSALMCHVQTDSNLQGRTCNGMLYWKYAESGWIYLASESFYEVEPKFEP